MGSLDTGEGWLVLDMAAVVVLLVVAILEYAAIRSPNVRDSRGSLSARWLIGTSALALAGRGVYSLFAYGDWMASPLGMLPIIGIALGLCLQLLERIQGDR